MMTKTISAGLIGAMIALAPAPALATGCLRGAAVGGVAGHYAHHHAVMGAAAGCLIARHHYKKVARQQQAQAQGRR